MAGLIFVSLVVYAGAIGFTTLWVSRRLRLGALEARYGRLAVVAFYVAMALLAYAAAFLPFRFL